MLNNVNLKFNFNVNVFNENTYNNCKKILSKVSKVS